MFQTRPFLLLLICTSLFCPLSVRAEDASVVEPSEELRTQLKLSPFYKKCLTPGGFPIVCSDKVSDFALCEAAYVVNSMLAGRDDVTLLMFDKQTGQMVDWMR